MKRAFDLGLALGGLVMMSPLLAAAAGLVKLSSPGPAIYRGTRVGRDGRTFEILKLRTMRSGADTQGPALTSAADARITPVGRFLRRTKFDEVPQLVNVLRGEMSLVGPRPEHPDFVKHYSDDQRQVLSVRPGLTSPAALAYIREEEMLVGDDPVAQYVSTIMPRKLALDLDYVRTATFAGDLKIIGRTLARVIVRR
jgi:lipopolysaccharide/colanic/teichoic acid biosynthesis glycosyltransferase